MPFSINSIVAMSTPFHSLNLVLYILNWLHRAATAAGDKVFNRELLCAKRIHSTCLQRLKDMM